MGTIDNLKGAFAGESQANRKYLAYAKKADQDKLPGIADNVRIRVLDTGKLIGTTCDLHTSLVCDLEERFGKENVVVK